MTTIPYIFQGEDESQAAKWSQGQSASDEGVRQRIVEHIEPAETIIEQQEVVQQGQDGSNQGNTLILFLLVAIALLLYRRIFLLE